MDENRIKFALRKIKTEQFAINEDGYKPCMPINLANSFKFGVDVSNRIVIVSTFLKFEIEKAPFILLGVSCHFEIESESWNTLMEKNKSQLVLPLEIATHLLLLTIGTARGILHSKTESTEFNKFFLPTLNVSKMIEHDIKIDLA